MSLDHSHLQRPFVSLNGTDAELLAKHYANASNAVREAIVAVEQSGPNGRDYQSEDDLKLAQQEHRERIDALREVRDELTELALSVRHQM